MLEIGQYFWLAAFLIFLLAEAVTMGLATIWFAGGSLAAFAVNLLGGDGWIQVAVFFAVSFLLLVFTRPFAVKYINRTRVRTNVDEVAGETAIVTEDIDNLRARGRVRLKDMDWKAKAADKDTVIPEGEAVEILSVEGVTLIVRKTDLEKKE